jgi:hypothetical protein
MWGGSWDRRDKQPAHACLARMEQRPCRLPVPHHIQPLATTSLAATVGRQGTECGCVPIPPPQDEASRYRASVRTEMLHQKGSSVPHNIITGEMRPSPAEIMARSAATGSPRG